MAINVDGPTPGESPVYLSGKMDKQVLSSTHSGLSTARYVIGTLKESELHLTPLHSMVHMRPSFSYLDKVTMLNILCKKLKGGIFMSLSKTKLSKKLGQHPHDNLSKTQEFRDEL